MTTQEKIDYLKALKTKDAEQVSASTKAPGGFDLKGQFTTATAEAVMAANARGKFLPAADDQDFSDDSDGIPASDDDSTTAHIKRCQNHLEQCDEDMCAGAPTDGSPDHMALAHRHLTEALEMRARAGRLAAVGQQHVGVRFA